MKGAKLSLMFLACTAATSAFAQNTTDSQCGMTNLDRSSNMFTIVNPTAATATQQCFITVVPKESWTGGMPDLASSQLVEGNYEITLSGGGGGGGGGRARFGGGDGGAGAVPLTVVRYLEPGVYRMTIGSGGLGGVPNGGNGADGAPTSLSKANSSETVAGFSGAENWNGSYPWSYAAASGGRRVSDQAGVAGRRADSMTYEAEGPAGQAMGGNGGRIGIGINPKGQDGGRLVLVASSGAPGKGGTDLAGHRFRHEVGGGGGGGAGFGNGGDGDSAAEDGKMKTGAMSGMLGGGGGGGAGGEGVADPGAPGGNGFIRIALKDAPPSAASARPEPAPAYVAPMAPVSEAPAPVVETVEPARPARMDRN